MARKLRHCKSSRCRQRVARQVRARLRKVSRALKRCGSSKTSRYCRRQSLERRMCARIRLPARPKKKSICKRLRRRMRRCGSRKCKVKVGRRVKRRLAVLRWSQKRCRGRARRSRNCKYVKAEVRLCRQIHVPKAQSVCRKLAKKQRSCRGVVCKRKGAYRIRHRIRRLRFRFTRWCQGKRGRLRGCSLMRSEMRICQQIKLPKRPKRSTICQRLKKRQKKCKTKRCSHLNAARVRKRISRLKWRGKWCRGRRATSRVCKKMKAELSRCRGIRLPAKPRRRSMCKKLARKHARCRSKWCSKRTAWRIRRRISRLSWRRKWCRGKRARSTRCKSLAKEVRICKDVKLPAKKRRSVCRMLARRQAKSDTNKARLRNARRVRSRIRRLRWRSMWCRGKRIASKRCQRLRKEIRICKNIKIPTIRKPGVCSKLLDERRKSSSKAELKDNTKRFRRLIRKIKRVLRRKCRGKARRSSKCQTLRQEFRICKSVKLPKRSGLCKRLIKRYNDCTSLKGREEYAKKIRRRIDKLGRKFYKCRRSQSKDEGKKNVSTSTTESLCSGKGGKGDSSSKKGSSCNKRNSKSSEVQSSGCSEESKGGKLGGNSESCAEKKKRREKCDSSNKNKSSSCGNTSPDGNTFNLGSEEDEERKSSKNKKMSRMDKKRKKCNDFREELRQCQSIRLPKEDRVSVCKKLGEERKRCTSTIDCHENTRKVKQEMRRLKRRMWGCKQRTYKRTSRCVWLKKEMNRCRGVLGRKEKKRRGECRELIDLHGKCSSEKCREKHGKKIRKALRKWQEEADKCEGKASKKCERVRTKLKECKNFKQKAKDTACKKIVRRGERCRSEGCRKRYQERLKKRLSKLGRLRRRCEGRSSDRCRRITHEITVCSGGLAADDKPIALGNLRALIWELQRRFLRCTSNDCRDQVSHRFSKLPMGAQDDACGVLHQRLTQCFSQVCKERVKRLLDLCPDLSDLSGANLVASSAPSGTAQRDTTATNTTTNNDNLLFIIIVVVLASVILLLLLVLIILCVYLRRNSASKRKRRKKEVPLVDDDYLNRGQVEAK